MKLAKLIHLLIAFLFMYIPPPTFAVGKHALLIGIQDYSSSDTKSLKGSINDVTLMQGILRERFGFQDKHLIIYFSCGQACLLDAGIPKEHIVLGL